MTMLADDTPPGGIAMSLLERMAVEENLIESSPMVRLEKPRVAEESIEPFPREQVTAILETAL